MNPYLYVTHESCPTHHSCTSEWTNGDSLFLYAVRHGHYRAALALFNKVNTK